MEGVAVEALALTLGTFRLKKLEFTLGGGEVLVILGPNGSGKSVTLETIAGFHRTDSGRVIIGGRDVTALPPERRRVGFVVQNFGLFPHLSVAQNVAIARSGKGTTTPRYGAFLPQGDPTALLAHFGILHLANRSPPDLSPGEKQRVALARALAGAPDLFLFDEPFSALDSQTRDQLRGELLSFLRKLSIPAIFVTHDHTDAMMLGDRIVVLRDGAMMQSGSAAEIFRKPVNSFVARFVGIENVLPASVRETSGDYATLSVGPRTLRAIVPRRSEAVPNSVLLAIRAEDVTVLPPPTGQAMTPELNHLSGHVIGMRQAGPLVTVEIDCGFRLKAYLLAPQVRGANIGLDCPVAATIAPEAIHVIPE